jgi:hypothetical protein
VDDILSVCVCVCVRTRTCVSGSQEAKKRYAILLQCVDLLVIITRTIAARSCVEVLKHLLWDINSILLYKRPKLYVALTALLGSKLSPSAAK